MMKSNSLTNRILALALTVVMLLGMMPSGALAADTQTEEPVAPVATEEPVRGVAQVGETTYETLAEAVAAAESGATVTLLGNASGAGVVIDKDITIDFAGYTYTLTEPVGSTGTVSNGLQLLSGNKVTLTNGTLTVAEADKGEFYILVQNYADSLTVTDMTLDGTNLDKYSGTDGDSYALSNNSGNVTINGNTNIIANNEGSLAYAFDVCQYGSYAAPSVTVAGGTINGNVDVSEIGSSTFVITGGTFTDTSVAPYVAEDKKLSESGAVVAKDYIAEVGGKKYETLAEAVAAAESGATVTLLGNASGAGVVVDKDITIDFAGYTYTLTEGVGSTGTPTNGLQLLSGSDVVLKNGTLTVAEANKNDFYILVQNYADSLTVTDMTLDGTNLDKYSATDGDSYTLSNNSGNVTISGNTNIIANKDGDKAYAFDVCQFGDYAAPTVTLGEDFTGTITGAIEVSEGLESNLTIKGGSFDTDVSAYVPIGYKQENGTVIIDSVIDTEAELRYYIALGGEVTLGANIALTGPITIDKNVTLNLNGCKLTLPDHSNYGIVVEDSLTINGDGYVHVNGKYGIGLSTSCTGGLTINGGTFTGAGDCVYMIGAFNGYVTINDGEFDSGYCVVNNFSDYYNTACTVTIIGGTLEADYPVLGNDIIIGEKATVEMPYGIWKINDDYYIDLAAAVAGAQDNDILTLLGDGSGSGAVVDKNVTIDFGGYTYELTYPVGSTGTVSNGLQLLSGSNVTLQNGTLTVAEENADEFYILVQNYANLTVRDMNLNGEYLDKYATGNDQDSYVLSNNSGEVLITGNTNITVNTDGEKSYAFDVCQYGSYTAPTVTLDESFTGVITGPIEVSEGLEEKLDIHNGTFTVDVSEYCVDGKTAELVDGKYIVKRQQTFAFAKAEHSVDYKDGLVIEANDNKLTVQGSNAVVYSIAAAEGTKAENASIDAATGKVTVSGVGTFVITAKQEDDDTYASAEASYTLTVNKGESVITLKNDDAVNLTFGVTSYTMPIETVGGDEITYAISGNDEGVAVEIKTNGELRFDNTVDQMGTFTVTITIAESDNYKGTEATYTVALSHAEISADACTLVCDEPAVNGWYKHNVTIQPAATYKICEVAADGKLGAWVDAIIAKDGIHNKTVYLMDENGGISAPIQINLQVDTQAPVVNITDELPVLKTIWDKLFFVAKDDVTLHVTYKDVSETVETSGIASVKISLDGGENYTTLSGIDTKSGAFEINLPVDTNAEGTRYVVLVRVWDTAGNMYEAEVNPTEDGITTIVVDGEGPEISTEVNGAVESSGIYFTKGENFTIGYTVTDENLAVYDPANPNKLNLTTNGTTESLSVEFDKEKDSEFVTKFSTVFTPNTAADGKYTITANITDTAGNPADADTQTYIVDKEEPEITLTSGIDLVKNDVYYTSKENYGLKIELDEGLYEYYSNNGGFEPEITVTRNGKEYQYSALEWTAEAGSSVRETVLTLAENGVYVVTVSYKNHLWEAETQTITICVDYEVPDFALDSGEAIFIEEKDVYHTNSTGYGLKISLSEDLYQHYYEKCGFEPKVTVNNEAVDLDWDEPDATLFLPDEGDYVVTVSYENYLWQAETESINITVDRTKPEVEITYEGIDNPTVRPSRADEKTGNVAVFGQAVTAVITVNEVNFDKATVTVNGNATVYPVDQWDTNGSVHTLRIPLQSDDNYTIEVSAVDYATNANETLKHLGEDVTYALADVDTTEPSDLYIAYEQSFWENFLDKVTFGRFYGDQTTVTVYATDVISGINEFRFEYILAPNVGAPNAGSEEAQVVIETEDIKFGYDEEKGVYSYRFKIPTEALTNTTQFNGSLKFVATDWAGNDTTFESLDIQVEGREDAVDYYVIVDSIRPVGNFDLSQAVNKTETVAYYNGNIVLNININEANFYSQDVVITVTKDGAAYTGYTMAGWYGGSNVLTLTEDGDYQVGITYTDRSRNSMQPYASGNLTLDTVAPVITVSNIEQNSANKDEVYGFTITVTDINLDADSVKPVLTAVVQGEDGLYSTKQIDLGNAQRSEDGDTVTFTVENLDADALYSLRCTAEDMSDNVCSEIVLEDGKAYEDVKFSINRNGSTYGFGNEYVQNLVGQYFVYSVYEDLKIVEVNVDPIENYTITVNGTVLVEDTHYTTQQTSKDGEWSKRTYTIKKEYFAEEREYNVIVSSTDKAETTAYSDIKDLAIGFVVDKTAPVLNISGLQTGGRYQTEEQTVTMIPTDEGGRLNSLKVVVMNSNGEPLTDKNGNDISVRFESSGEELLDYLSANGDMVTFTIPSGLEHQVQIICNDCAVNAEGLTNETVETYDRVTVSQNALIIFYADKPAFYGTLAGVAALIILIIVLVKRKKNEKK